MTQLFIVGRLQSSNVIGKMESDLSRISAAIRDDDFSGIDFPTPKGLAESLNVILELSTEMSKSSDIDKVTRLLRHYVFLVKRHRDKIYSLASHVDFAPLDTQIKLISEKIGEIPVLNREVKLPDEKFLPKDIKKTQKKWKAQPCEHPKRGGTIAAGGIGFMCRDSKTAARKWLEDRAEKIECIDTTQGRLYLNLIDFDYYQLGLMHADHLLPSASLIKRIKEMIEAMNYDSSFQKEMEETYKTEGYFLRSLLDPGKTIGTYWLYMSYHNSIENLWFLLASDNAGDGKLADDPVDWLNAIKLGKKYLKYLQDNGKQIDRSKILYVVTPDGISLKDSFVAWAMSSQARLIKTYKSVAELGHELRRKIEVSESVHDGRKALIETRAEVEDTKRRVSSSKKRGRQRSASPPASEESFPTVNTGSSDEFLDEFLGEAENDDELNELEAKIADRRKTVAIRVQARRRQRKLRW